MDAAECENHSHADSVGFQLDGAYWCLASSQLFACSGHPAWPSIFTKFVTI